MNTVPTTEPADGRLSFSKLILFGLQHLLVVAYAPITAAFLVAKALNLSPALTVDLISATFLTVGLGTVLQSLGPAKLGAKLPFVLVPGGAPLVLFIVTAQQTNIQTAVGSVMLTSLLYFFLLPIFSRCLRFFPRVVIGALLLLVGVNLIKIYGGVVFGAPGAKNYGDPMTIGLALSTIAATVFFARCFRGTIGQLAILLGLVTGTIFASFLGQVQVHGVLDSGIFRLPSPFPFGFPQFDLVASIPLFIFSIISMTEATGQTIAVAEVVGQKIDPRKIVPLTIRGDAIASLFGSIFGTSLMITSGENIGIIQATGVRSRYVTAMAGLFLTAIALLAPLAILVNAIPTAVVGGTALIVFAVVAIMGINILKEVDLHDRANFYTLATALCMGLLPIMEPGLYSRVPGPLQQILNNGVAIGTLTAIAVNIIFNHLIPRKKAPV